MIPQNSKIKVIFPSSIQIATSLGCEITKNTITTTLSSFTQQSPNPLTYLINDGFSSGDYTTASTPF